MTTNPSLTRKKWWHATLSILNRESGEELVHFSTIGLDENNNFIANANNDPTIFAYSSSAPVCDIPIPIPVPAYDFIASPGIFVFRPTASALEDAIVKINTYQDAINLNNRRTFEYVLYAGYDPLDENCFASEPAYIDNTPYQVTVNNLNTNIFEYPVMELYDFIGCCTYHFPIRTIKYNSNHLTYFQFISN
jgi:hypothetical protein